MKKTVLKAGLVRWLFCGAALVGGVSSAFSEESDPPADTVVLTVGAFEGGRLEDNGVPRQPGDTVSVSRGTTMTLVATPGDGFAFMGSSGDLTPAEAQEPTLTVTMDAARRTSRSRSARARSGEGGALGCGRMRIALVSATA